MISLELSGGGYYTGTPQQCICFLADHRYMVVHQHVIDRYFHWSETKGQYLYIPDMHPNYIRNVLLKEIRTMKDIRGLFFIESIMTDYTLEHELVGGMYRLWCEMFIEWHEHRDALIAELESSPTPEDEAITEDVPLSNGCPDGAVLL